MSGGKIQRQSVSIIDKIKNSFSSWNFSLFSSSKRTKCQCDSDLEDNSKTCNKAMEWILSVYDKKDLEKLKKEYQDLYNLIEEKALDKQKVQIEKDLNRTFVDKDYLDKNALRNVLTVWSIYDPNVGYVQGMNFILATLLYHAEEYIAFYLFDLLTDRFEMRDIYQHVLCCLVIRNCLIEVLDYIFYNVYFIKIINISKGLPGLNKHCKMINKLIEAYIPNAHTLFSIFYDHLFKQKWIYFYKVVLQILDFYQEELLELDYFDILQFFSQKNLKFFTEQEINDQKIDWEDQLNDASLIIIDQSIIDSILEVFDSESKDFNEETTGNIEDTSGIIQETTGNIEQIPEYVKQTPGKSQIKEIQLQ